jgi:hypothetical protein
LGIRVFRVRNERVFQSLPEVIAEILAEVGALAPRLTPGAFDVQYCPPAYARGGKKPRAKNERKMERRILSFNAKYWRR